MTLRWAVRSFAVPLALALSTLCAPASAADAADSLHGRFDGDLGAAFAAGATFGPSSPRASLDLRLRYLSTAGIFGTYEDGPLLGDSDPRRVLATGVELRPLFLGRWARDLETGNARLDLFIDSFALELGVAFVQPEGARFGARPALQTGIGLELPIFANATGPLVGIHGGARFSDAALAGGPLDGPADRALYLALSLGWQQLFGAHVASLGDPPR